MVKSLVGRQTTKNTPSLISRCNEGAHFDPQFLTHSRSLLPSDSTHLLFYISHHLQGSMKKYGSLWPVTIHVILSANTGSKGEQNLIRV
ncbi:hypothetical protein SRDD_30060 [Serratia sp. DD3]|nr:hypothetical protein SRDD_30060 [Serratia sp. DD3]